MTQANRTARGDTAPVLPHNPEAEKGILGSILLDNVALAIALEHVRPEDFFLPVNRHIFQCMVLLSQKGLPVNTVLLAEHLSRTGELESAGGPAYLSSLADEGFPQATNVAHYGKIVKEKAILRNLIYSTSTIQEQAFAQADDPRELVTRAAEQIKRISCSDTSNWLDLFDTPEEMENAPPLSFAIDGFLQCEAATLLAGLSGHYKTWIMLSVAKALLDERIEKLWDTFNVVHKAKRVVYLIPESARGPFYYRVEVLRLQPYIRNRRLIVRTLSKGPAPSLQDSRILSAAEGSDVMLDTAVRFMQGEENSAGDNARGLASDMFALLSAGARLLFAAAHSPKAFETQNYMSLENMVRGSGDIGAAFATVWGVRQLAGDIAHIQNIKPRDFEPCGPFQIAARPHLNQSNNFGICKRPGECELLAEEMPDTKKKSGASPDTRETKALKMALLRRLYAEDPGRTWEEIVSIFKAEGLEIARGTIRKYKSVMSKSAPKGST